MKAFVCVLGDLNTFKNPVISTIEDNGGGDVT